MARARRTSATPDVPGLRERKKARTRSAIVRATLELTLEHGFAAATIPQIAERADVAPRTVSLYFPHKDGIVFDAGDEAFDRLVAQLTHGDGDLVDRLRDWVSDEGARVAADDVELLRARAIASDPDLRMRARLLMEAVEEKIAAAVADELGEPPTGVGPRAFAAATLAVLFSVRDAYLAATPSTDPSVALELDLERGLAFVRGGLAALHRPA